MIRISWMLVSYWAAAIVILAGPDQPEQAIDTERSFVTVHVGKTGVLSAAAHEHWVDAPIAGGTIAADGSTPAVRFTVLPARERSHVVVRRARIEVTSLALRATQRQTRTSMPAPKSKTPRASSRDAGFGWPLISVVLCS
jgi:hypothetical protein